jgi:hypothetical protein
MKKIYFLLFYIIFLSCNSYRNDETAGKINQYNGIFVKTDSAQKSNPFVDIKQVKIYNSKKMINVDITINHIPDSIAFNNPMITKGYCEYSLSIEFDLKNDSSYLNNVKASISYNNFDNYKKGRLYESFEKFITYCKKGVNINTNRHVVYYYDILTFSITNNTFHLRIPKSELPDSIKIDSNTTWKVSALINSPKKTGINLFNEDEISPKPSNFKLPSSQRCIIKE